MLRKRSPLTVGLLFAAAVLTAAGTAEAKPKKNDEHRRRQQQRAAYDQRIRQNQMRLKILEREEAVIRRQVQQLDKQIPAAREKLKQAQQQLQSTQMAVGSAQQVLERAKAATKSASENLAAIAKDVQENQPADSPFARAMTGYLTAKAEYARAVEAIINSKAYKEAYGRAAASASRGRLLVALRKEWIDNDPAVKKARYQLETGKTAYDNLRAELLRNSSDWLAASGSLSGDKQRESEAQQEARSVAGRYATMKRLFAKMQSELRMMEAALPRGKAALKRIPEMRKSIQRQIESDRRARNRIR